MTDLASSLSRWLRDSAHVQPCANQSVAGAYALPLMGYELRALWRLFLVGDATTCSLCRPPLISRSGSHARHPFAAPGSVPFAVMHDELLCVALPSP